MEMEGRIRVGDKNSATVKNDNYHANDGNDIEINRTTGTIVNPWELTTDIKSNLRVDILVDAYGKLRTTTKIDLVAFVTYSTGFLVFNVIYYYTYNQK